MPLPSSIADLSQTPGSNSPAGSESTITADDYLRYYASYIATLRDGKGFTDPVSLASATTTDIGAQNAMFVEVTGTTTITGFGTTYNGPRFLRFTGILTLTHHATNLNLPGAANITTAAGDTCIVVPNSTPNGWNVVQYQLASGVPGVSASATNIAGGAVGDVHYQSAAGTTAFLSPGTQGRSVVSAGATTAPVFAIPVLRGYIDGLTLSTAGSSATMSIAAGVAANSSNVYVMELSSAISKTTSAWSVGTAAGGLDTGAIANATWYYFYLIRRTDTGVVDVVFSTSSSSPTLPANYTQYRYIGAGLTDGSAQWVRFVQYGDYFQWYNPPLDVDATTNTTAALSTLTVPRGRKMLAKFNLYVSDGTSGAGRIYISDPDVLDEAVSSSAAPLATVMFNAGASDFSAVQAECFTDTSAQIRRVGQNATNHCRLSTLGWVDNRGRNA